MFAAHYGRLPRDDDDDDDDDIDNDLILHAALALRAQNKVFTWILNGVDGASRPRILRATITTRQRGLVQPRHDVRKRDYYNHLPLHYAVQIPAVPQRQNIIIKKLLIIYPQAAWYQDPSTKRLPLHVALSNGYRWKDGIRELYCCNRRANQVGDNDPCYYYYTHNFPPFLIAAMYSDIETTYCLLRRFPTLVKSAIME
jgi:hypothetical protein